MSGLLYTHSLTHALISSLASFVFDYEELFSVQLNADRSSCYFGTVVYKYFWDVMQLQITLSKSIFKIFCGVPLKIQNTYIESNQNAKYIRSHVCENIV